MEMVEKTDAGTKNMVVEDDSYTVVSLCDDLASAEEDLMWTDGSCCACPNYTTVPCSC
jgi:hypothetical protein